MIARHLFNCYVDAFGGPGLIPGYGSMFNRYKCNHQWAEVGRTYNPSTLQSVDHMPSHLFEVAAFGITNIEQKCELCGLINVTRLIGKVNS